MSDFQFTEVQSSAIQLIEAFVKERSSTIYRCANVQGEVQKISIQLPRQSGTTTIAQELAHRYGCLVICANKTEQDNFIGTYSLRYSLGYSFAVSIFDLRPGLALRYPEQFKHVSEALSKSPVIIMDGFRSYSENQTVKILFKEFSNHIFVLLH